MTPKKAKRYEIVKRLIRLYGFRHKGYLVISLWDMAHNINNTWRSKYFLTEEKLSEYAATNHGDNIAIRGHRICELFPAIRHAVKDTDIQLCNDNNEYLEFKE